MSDKSKSTTETADDSDRSPQVGALLRASRERVGEDLRNVSDDLCIRFLYLEAIEECRYDDLPGDTYAIGFIRSYAEHLGLDGEEVIRRYRMERASGKRLSDLSFPTPVPESGVPKGAIVLVGAVLAVLVYGGWYVSTTEDTILSDLIAPVPERLQHLVEDESKPAETSETTPNASAPTAEQGSETVVQNEPSVNSETQEALQANTAEAIAEATEAARDNIEDTVATAVESATETAGTVAEETETAVQKVAEAASETAEMVVEQATEAVVEVAEAVTTQTEEVTSTTEPEVTEVAETEPPTSQTDETTQAAENNDSSTPTNDVTDTETNSATAGTSTQAEATSSTDTETTPEVTENTDVNSAVVEESAATPEPEAQPEVREVSAEDLNALALQAASGGPAPEQTPAPSPTVETASAPSTAETTTPASDASSGIVIRASDNSWVQVTDPSSGEILFTGLMAPGASFNVPARSGLLLDTGNAGAIDVIVNGTTAPKLGGVGDVRKGIVLNGARLIAGTAGN